MSDSQLLLTPAARADLGNIWSYTAQHWSDDQAEHYTGEIVAACRALAAGTRKGRAIDDIYRGYLKLPVEPIGPIRKSAVATVRQGILTP